MNIKQIRIANILFTGIMLVTGHLVYLWYITAMHVSLEVLNRKHLYLQQAYKFYNTVFWLYELVLLERLRTHFFSGQTEWLFNCAEHLFFGIVVCIKIYIYTAVQGKGNSWQRWNRGLMAFFIFNAIGVLNEIFQNDLAGRKLFVFIPDSIKDMQMNLIGAGAFFAAVLYRAYSLHCKNKKQKIILQAASTNRPL